MHEYYRKKSGKLRKEMEGFLVAVVVVVMVGFLVSSQLRCLAANVHDATPTEITTTAIDAGRRAPKANMLRTEEVLDP